MGSNFENDFKIKCYFWINEKSDLSAMLGKVV